MKSFLGNFYRHLATGHTGMYGCFEGPPTNAKNSERLLTLSDFEKFLNLKFSATTKVVRPNRIILNQLKKIGFDPFTLLSVLLIGLEI